MGAIIYISCKNHPVNAHIRVHVHIQAGTLTLSAKNIFIVCRITKQDSLKKNGTVGTNFYDIKRSDCELENSNTSLIYKKRKITNVIILILYNFHQ